MRVRRETEEGEVPSDGARERERRSYQGDERVGRDRCVIAVHGSTYDCKSGDTEHPSEPCGWDRVRQGVNGM